jgi:hypothetical protein
MKEERTRDKKGRKKNLSEGTKARKESSGFLLEMTSQELRPVTAAHLWNMPILQRYKIWEVT